MPSTRTIHWSTRWNDRAGGGVLKLIKIRTSSTLTRLQVTGIVRYRFTPVPGPGSRPLNSPELAKSHITYTGCAAANWLIRPSAHPRRAQTGCTAKSSSNHYRHDNAGGVPAREALLQIGRPPHVVCKSLETLAPARYRHEMRQQQQARRRAPALLLAVLRQLTHHRVRLTTGSAPLN